MTRKLRSNSFAARLSEAQRDELMEALWTSRWSLDEAAGKVAEWTGQTVSRSALSRYFHQRQIAWRMERARKAGEAAEAAAPKDLDERARAAVGYQKMVSVLGGELAPKDIAAFERNELARRKQELEERRLEIDERKLTLLERKAAAADEAEGLAGDEHLSDEEKTRRLKEIFGIR
jgi:hypothetical protein